MRIKRRALFKWTALTILFGGHSFFLGGIVIGFSTAGIIAMTLGMVTLILLFSAIESHPWYQAKRTANAAFARAMRWGLKLRGLYTILTALGYEAATNHFWEIISLATLADMWIGKQTILLTRHITGIDLAMGMRRDPAIAPAPFVEWVSTYLTTLITGLIHAAILALLCAILYLFFRLCGVKSSSSIPAHTSE